MAYRFTAQLACGFDDPDQDDCVMAGVAESNDEEGFSLLFMCDFGEPDAQEVSLGMDTHCLVTPDQGTAYGCVREVELDGNVLRVTLDPSSLDALGLADPVVEALLHAPAADVARMREVLPRILTYGRPDARPRLVEL
ncbi:Imm10 family immunity protein [Streptomyces chiangmaiensis]|uniref:Imm10 family immunity protein n=1 Tax=Streptomyces chiangmaiensis TaxID=766497 RepID=A0ABU7FUZ7_9ACTN|nr:Imm10 family immunity protein [Streptomyces chiangmaiensis]MED7827749.1 Imm10 family immunity protein [Streptomyces chiangmaiensis]